MTATDRVLAECPLRLAPFPAPAGVCAWCGTALPKGRRRWCSDECVNELGRNHGWNQARAAAMTRDGNVCVRCGAAPDWREGRDFLHLLGILNPPPRCLGPVEWARQQGYSTYEAREHHAFWSRYRMDLMRSWDGAEAVLRRELHLRALEVNHKTPILGRHGEFGCHHHLDGLETLCHRCHVRETARQFGHRTAQAESLFGATA